MRFSLLLAALLFVLPAAAQPSIGCGEGRAEAFLDASGVRAKLFNSGSLFWKGDPAVYEVPKGRGVTPLFVSSLRLGGYIKDKLRIAAATYDDYEFYPGPLEDAAAPPADCTAYDRIWTVTSGEVIQLLVEGEVSPNVAAWPAQLGAPVIDGDGDPETYDPAGGDYPAVRGAQTAFWVMHDVGPHVSTGSAPLGVEVQVLA